MSDTDELTEPGPDEDPSVLDRLRRSGVGTQDPNIVGDAGPGDVPLGADHDHGEGHVFTE